MDRRTFIGAFAGGLVIARSVADAQPATKVYRIGLLSLLSAESAAAAVSRALNDGLRDLGYVEGRNIIFERRYADGKLERLPDLATELVRLRVDVIVAATNPSVAAAKRATATIPIVMRDAGDPVGAGFIASLARPGGNITGVTVDANPEIYAKNLGLLTDIVPRLSRVGVLRQVGSGSGFAELAAAARKLNIALEVVDIRSLDDIDGAFVAMTSNKAGAVMFIGGALIFQRRQQIADWALKHRLPAIHLLKEYAQAGLLITNGPNLEDLSRRAAGYVAKILKGANPADLPVEQPAKFELVINLKTAKTLGLTIPQSLLLRADEVIQ
jgi:putative ABC transport system substrate-binding protein